MTSYFMLVIGLENGEICPWKTLKSLEIYQLLFVWTMKLQQLHGYNICSDLAGEVTCHSLKDMAETRFTCSIFHISLLCDLQSTCVAKMMVLSQKNN